MTRTSPGGFGNIHVNGTLKKKNILDACKAIYEPLAGHSKSGRALLQYCGRSINRLKVEQCKNVGQWVIYCCMNSIFYF